MRADVASRAIQLESELEAAIRLEKIFFPAGIIVCETSQASIGLD